MAREVAGRLKLTKDGKKFSVLTVWRNDMGGYSVSPDKHSEQYPSMGLFDALKAWGQGAYLDYWVEKPRNEHQEHPRGRRPQTIDGPRLRQEDVDPDPFNGDDLPF